MRPMNFCSRCGAKLREDAKYCQNCGAAVQPSPVDVPAAPITTPKQAPPKRLQHTEDRPMKWFMFIVYFQLIIVPFFQICSGIANIGGFLPYEDADLVYLAFPDMRTLDVLYGLAAIAEAVCFLFARHWLVKGRKKGIKWYLFTWLASDAVSFLYALLAFAIIGVFDKSELLVFVFGIVYFILNKIYFDKRAEMFSD